MEITRRDNGQPSANQAISLFEPAKLFRELMRWEPFQAIGPVSGIFERSAAFQPSFDIKETKDAYIVKADVPGMREQDIKLSMSGPRLQITGERTQERQDENDTYYTCERTFGSFTRVFTMPDDVDADRVNGEMKDGVLTVTLAKKAGAQPKHIPLKSLK